MDEYNNIVIRNDELPKNAYASVTIKNDLGVTEARSVSELSEKVIEESGSLHTAPLAATTTKAQTAQSISTAVSQVTVTASAVTVVAAVVAVAVVTTAGAAAPAASITGAGVKYYNYGSDVCVEFVLEDDESEIESLYAWIEDGAGQEITCEITSDGGVYLANAELTEQTSGEPIFVVYCITADGWEGELYRGALLLPSAPEIGVEYAAEYSAESGELTVTYELYGGGLNGYTVHVFDSDGEIESTVDYETGTITASADGGSGLYLVVYCESSDGWMGEIFNELMTVTELPEEEEQPAEPETPEEDEPTDPETPEEEEPTDPETPEEDEPTVTPTAPDVGVEYTTAYDATTGGLTIIYELYDDNGELSGYTVQILDSGGSEVTSIVDYTANTVTLPETDAAAELYLVINGTSVDGWTGELFNEAIAIPSAPDVTVSEVLDESWYEEGGAAYMYVYFSGNTADITFSYWFEDDYGNIIACEIDEETEEYVCVYAAFDGSVDFTLDERGRLSFVVSATTADGWTGELYREKFVIEPVAPDVEVTGVTVTSYSYDTTLTVQFTVEDINGEIASYEAWYSDYVGYSDCTMTQDGYTFTATADVSGLDTSGNLAFYVYCVTYDGWSNYLYGDNLTLPTAPDLTAEVFVDSAMYSDAIVYVNVYYTGDTSVISAYEYWFEDEDGNKFVYDLGDVYDGAVYGTTTLSPSDNPVLDTYGRMNFVIAVTTADGWQGEIYREKYTIATNGYLTYPELTGVTITYYETDIYTEMQITAYDPDFVWTALYLTLTDAGGEVITSLDLTISVETSVTYNSSETDAEGITTYYVEIYETTLTPFGDGTVKVYLLADYYNDEGNISAYVVVDEYYIVTTE